MGLEQRKILSVLRPVSHFHCVFGCFETLADLRPLTPQFCIEAFSESKDNFVLNFVVSVDADHMV